MFARDAHWKEKPLTKVAELALPLVGDEQVGGGEVPVDHPMLVGVRQGSSSLQGQVQPQAPAAQQLVPGPRLR